MRGLHFVPDTGDRFFIYIHWKNLVLGESREELDSHVGRENEEEKLMKQAIPFFEEAEENDNEEEDNNGEDAQEEEEEEELLRQAIALSLEGGE